METDQKFTVFIPRIDGTVWMGGKQYFDNLAQLVNSYFPNVNFHETDFDHSSFYPKKNNLSVRLKRKISGVGYVDEYRKNIKDHYGKLANHSIPIFFTNGIVNETVGIPYIIWIADFQFMHLKECATPAYLKACEDAARQGAMRADRVMLSSQDALNDFNRLLPEYTSKVRVVPFAKKINAGFLDRRSLDVIEKYNLPDSFFYVSNQFWKHKNHIVVVNALKILKERGIKCSVVFSGHTHDFRNPLYFDELLVNIAEHGLQDRIHILGMIPFADVVSLIREANAVINPSKFEGWNTAVEEVKSIGKKMLLSDLAVHREQVEADAEFFGPDDPEKLAELLIKNRNKNERGRQGEDEINAQKKYRSNEEKFARNFYELLEGCASKK